jgi:hypothetical protein
VHQAAGRALDQRLPTELGVPDTPRSSPTTVLAPAAPVHAAPQVEFHTYFRFGNEQEKVIAKALECKCPLANNLARILTVRCRVNTEVFSLLNVPFLRLRCLSFGNAMASGSCVVTNLQKFGSAAHPLVTALHLAASGARFLLKVLTFPNGVRFYL